MANRVLMTVFIIFETNVIVNFISARCITTKESSVDCDSVLLLTDGYFNESIENVQNVKRLSINNNGSRLLVYYSAFQYFVNLDELVIQNCQIASIVPDTLKDLPLESISINYNGIEKILPGALRNLSSLQKLSASHNHLRTISRGVFENLPALNSLTLSNNEISSIEHSALDNLPHLSELLLDNNNIETIILHNIVSHPEQLEILWLHNNSLNSVSKLMLQKLSKLKLLNLGFNRISTIEENAFEQTPKLRTLVLTHNKLKEIDGNIFPRKGMKYLAKIYLDNNELMFLSSNFFFRLNKLKKITLVGNPWACSCLDVINRILVENGIKENCQDMYVGGKRPICVTADATDKVCTYQYDTELSDIYMNYGKQFPLYTDSFSCYL